MSVHPQGLGLAQLPFARRDLIMTGAGAAAVGVLAHPAPTRAATPSDAELFAFNGPDDGRRVFAVAFRSDAEAGATPPPVRFHAGPRVWSVASAVQPATVSPLAGGAHAFVGRTLRATQRGHEPYALAVLSAPASALPPGPLAVWAEIGGPGARRRVGDPAVAELLRQDPALASIYHKALPDQDETLFAEALAERIRLRGPGAVSPEAHGRRLATMLLPDVLTFDPDQPTGYTFAGRNGRRTSDQVEDLIATVLAGVVTAGPQRAGPFTGIDAFPYFKTSAA